MKKLILLGSGLVLAGLACMVHAEIPQPMPAPGFERPIPPSAGNYRYNGRVRIEKGRNDQGYQLHIYTSGDLDPESIQVSIQGRSILIENDRSVQREEQSERGYYSYSRSSSSFRRRLSIPRNADVENIQRTVGDGVLTITLPYLNDHR